MFIMSVVIENHMVCRRTFPSINGAVPSVQFEPQCLGLYLAFLTSLEAQLVSPFSCVNRFVDRQLPSCAAEVVAWPHLCMADIDLCLLMFSPVNLRVIGFRT